MYQLARYGDPTIFTMPSVLKTDLTCDMSFTSFQTYGCGLFYEQNDPLTGITIPRYQRPRRKLDLIQLINIASSLQFSVFSHVTRSIQRALQYCQNSKIKINGVYIVGDHNPTLELMISKLNKSITVKSESLPCQSHQVASLCQHLLSSDEAVDIRSIPLPA